MKSRKQKDVITWIGLGAGLVAGLLLSPPAAWAAKTLAYVFGGSEERIAVRTFDTDTDTVIARRVLPRLAVAEEDSSRIEDSPADNLLLVAYGRGEQFRVAAFDFTTLAFKRELDLVSRDEPELLVPPKVPYFYVRWFDAAANAGQGAERMTRYDKATLARIEDVPQVPFERFQGGLTFSVDGTRLYSYTSLESKPIDVFNTQTLQVVSTVDVLPLFSTPRWGEGILDVEGDRVLLVENRKTARAAPDRFALFTLRLTDGSRSPIIDTGLQGEAYLTPSGKKILFQESETRRAPDGISRLSDRPLGRLHVYDVATGAKLGQATYNFGGVPGEGGLIRVIRPQEDKVYVTQGEAEKDRVGVISLTTFSLIKEFVIEPMGGVTFFEQP